MCVCVCVCSYQGLGWIVGGDCVTLSLLAADWAYEVPAPPCRSGEYAVVQRLPLCLSCPLNARSLARSFFPEKKCAVAPSPSIVSSNLVSSHCPLTHELACVVRGGEFPLQAHEEECRVIDASPPYPLTPHMLYPPPHMAHLIKKNGEKEKKGKNWAGNTRPQKGEKKRKGRI